MSVASGPWIERVAPVADGKETVLDVGCSTGHVLTGIRDRAAECTDESSVAKKLPIAATRMVSMFRTRPLTSALIQVPSTTFFSYRCSNT